MYILFLSGPDVNKCYLQSASERFLFQASFLNATSALLFASKTHTTHNCCCMERLKISFLMRIIPLLNCSHFHLISLMLYLKMLKSITHGSHDKVKEEAPQTLENRKYTLYFNIEWLKSKCRSDYLLLPSIIYTHLHTYNPLKIKPRQSIQQLNK